MSPATDNDIAAAPDEAWRRLERELDAWRTAGLTADFWWRDDDAADRTPALDDLLDLQAEAAAPLALAVIPANMTASLRARLADAAGVTVLQHGYSHKNFAAPGARKIELDASRPAEYVVAELAAGAQALARLARHLPVLVPPWNRIAPHLVPLLPEIGFRGLSTIGARRRETPVAGLVQNNVHLDVVDWRGRRTGAAGGFAGAANVVGDAADILSARRRGAADAREATGLMTHHRVMTSGMLAFVREFLRRTGAHPAARWRPAGEVFAIP